VPFAIILEVTLQMLCIIHAVRTRRDRMWIYIILMPMVGPLAYVAAELLPEMLGGTAHKALITAKRALNPNKAYREAQTQFDISPTVHNRQGLAQACIDRELYDEAILHYRVLLTGHQATDPDLMRELARAQFRKGAHADALKTLDELKQHNPKYSSGEAHLVYARALEALDRNDEAVEEYRALCEYFSGEEARGRLVLLLRRMGRTVDAAEVAAQILRSERLAPKHYVNANREWIDAARASG
jgi:hypothetical protein